MRIAILTAGGAGMFCGSCMHDNTLARALIKAGHECVLVPCYTPIRVDEENQSESRVFLGGINLYLEHKWARWNRMPGSVRKLLDRPAMLKLFSRLGSRSDAAELGELTLAMFRGEHGPLRSEIPPLVDYLTTELQPDVIVYSNALMAGTLEPLRARFDGPIVCLLQGDDVFLDGLPEKFREPAIREASNLASRFDGLLSHTNFYADHMAEFLSVDRSLFRTVPLGIDESEYASVEEPGEADEVAIGFFARLAPEKGLHTLVDAFLRLHDDYPVRLRIGGFAHAKDRRYQRDLFARLSGKRFDPPVQPNTLTEKIAFYQSVDLLSVPTDFLEPKGLTILEAMASGRPVVQPAHGAFPEMLSAAGGGLLVTPRSVDSLADGLAELVSDRQRRIEFGRAGRDGVTQRFGMDAMARETVAVLSEFVGG